MTEPEDARVAASLLETWLDDPPPSLQRLGRYQRDRYGEVFQHLENLLLAILGLLEALMVVMLGTLSPRDAAHDEPDCDGSFLDVFKEKYDMYQQVRLQSPPPPHPQHSTVRGQSHPPTRCASLFCCSCQGRGTWADRKPAAIPAHPIACVFPTPTWTPAPT